jgi:hypothetical protein
MIVADFDGADNVYCRNIVAPTHSELTTGAARREYAQVMHLPGAPEVGGPVGRSWQASRPGFGAGAASAAVQKSASFLRRVRHADF